MFRKTEANGQVVQDRQLENREKLETILCKLEEVKNDVLELRCHFEGLKKLCLEDKGNALVYNECGIAYVRIKPPQEHHVNTHDTCLHCLVKPNAYVRMRKNLADLSLATPGLAILAWISWLTCYDLTVWSKNIATIFFGSRTGEAISLGIGMRAIHYFVIGVALLILGLGRFIRKRSKLSESHFIAQTQE